MRTSSVLEIEEAAFRAWPAEEVVELSLRPQRLAEFIGQPKVKESLKIG